MGRRPKPWYKASHRAWYTKIDGRPIRLGETEKEAEREFHRLMAERGTGGAAVVSRMSLESLADLWYDDIKGGIKPRTQEQYREYTQSLIRFTGRIQARELKPYHVRQWLKANPGWKSSSTQHLAVSIAKMITAWGCAMGYLPSDPWAKVKRPPMLRRKPVEPIAAERLVEGIRSPEFREFLAVAIETGCRPGELRTLEAGRIDWGARTAIVTGKMGERTVYLSARAIVILQIWAKRYPEGPVLRNTRGDPWGEKAIQCQFERAGKRVSPPVKVVPYHTRGLFASLALRRGVDSLLVAKLLGHRDLAMLERHYASVASDQLQAAVVRATEPPPPAGNAAAPSPAPMPKRPGRTPRKPQGPPPSP